MNDLMSGISIAIVPKFSLSRFWVDCIESQSTIFIYGKICAIALETCIMLIRVAELISGRTNPVSGICITLPS
jgi:hypothetical protein